MHAPTCVLATSQRRQRLVWNTGAPHTRPAYPPPVQHTHARDSQSAAAGRSAGSCSAMDMPGVSSSAPGATPWVTKVAVSGSGLCVSITAPLAGHVRPPATAATAAPPRVWGGGDRRWRCRAGTAVQPQCVRDVSGGTLAPGHITFGTACVAVSRRDHRGVTQLVSRRYAAGAGAAGNSGAPTVLVGVVPCRNTTLLAPDLLRCTAPSLPPLDTLTVYNPVRHQRRCTQPPDRHVGDRRGHPVRARVTA